MLAFWRKRFWSEGLGSLFLAILFALFIRWAFIEANVIPSESMWPTLLINDHIFVNKMAYGVRAPFTEKWIWRFGEPKRGEIIVFKSPENKKISFIKRVVGVPGDRIYYENGNLYVNDQLVEKYVPDELKNEYSWIQEKDFQKIGKGERSQIEHWEEKQGDYKYSILLDKEKRSSFKGPYEVPQDSYFVLGDNRDMSWDSRFWKSTKFVPRKNLLGRASIVWLSCGETFTSLSFLCKPQTIRWRRLFKSVHYKK